MNDRTPPIDLEAERAVLGSLILDREAIVVVAGWLQPDHFYQEKHRWIYEATLACYRRRIPPDLITVLAELRAVNRAAEVGELPGLVALTSEIPTAQHVEYYGRIVERLALCRRGIQAGGSIAAMFYESDRDADDLIGDALRALTSAVYREQAGEAVPAALVVDELVEEWNDGIIPGLSTGFFDLDAKLGGLQPGDLLVLAARPSVGKSALAAQLAANIADRGGHVLFFSLEMKRKKIMQRFIALIYGYDLSRLARHGWNDDELPRLLDTAGRIAGWQLFIEDTRGRTIGTMRSQTMQHMAKHGRPAVVIVDYLQLIRGDGKYNGNRVVEVGDVSRGLKELAMEIGCPVFALAQMSRAVEHRNDKTPTLADLRESGSIEADADVVLFIHREEMYDRDTDKKGVAEIHIGKNRQGPLGIVPLYYRPVYNQWGDLDKYRTPPGY